MGCVRFGNNQKYCVVFEEKNKKRSQMKKRKVLIVNNMIGYYGAENVLVNMVNNMDYSRYDITVLTLLECDSTQLNNEIHYKYIFRKKNEILHKVKNKLKLILSYKNLAKIYCRGFDIAIAFKMGECAHLVSFCNAPKKICWIHSNVTDIPENFSYSFSSIEDEKECMRKFDILVAVSHSCANSFTQKYGKSLSIIVSKLSLPELSLSLYIILGKLDFTSPNIKESSNISKF